MANTIKIKQSSVADKVPLAGDLVQGELAVNTADEKIYTKNSSGEVVELGVGSDYSSSATPPSDPEDGAHWFDSGNGILFVRVDSVWLDVSSNAGGGIDWTADQGSSNIHTGNYINTVYDDTAIAAAVALNTAKVSFDSTSSTKLDGIEALADVTDTTNVTAAGAAMLTGATFTGDVTSPSFIGNLEGATVTTCKNVSGGTLPKGTPVYQSGTAGNSMEVQAADSSSAATMPAVGVLAEDLSDEAEGDLIHFGKINGIDTSAFSEGDTIYVASGGGFTNVKPTGESNLIQNLGNVTKVHASNGGGVVTGPSRTNATPNLNDGNVFIGNASNQAAARALIIADTTGLQTALDGKVDDSQVLTDVPAGALFTDTNTHLDHDDVYTEVKAGSAASEGFYIGTTGSGAAKTVDFNYRNGAGTILTLGSISVSTILSGVTIDDLG